VVRSEPYGRSSVLPPERWEQTPTVAQEMILGQAEAPGPVVGGDRAAEGDGRRVGAAVAAQLAQLLSAALVRSTSDHATTAPQPQEASACNAPHLSSGHERSAVDMLVLVFKLPRGLIPQDRVEIRVMVVGDPGFELSDQGQWTGPFLQPETFLLQGTPLVLQRGFEMWCNAAHYPCMEGGQHERTDRNHSEDELGDPR
jgi:hypothetical protein